MIKGEDEKLATGPAGVAIELMENILGGYKRTVLTDEKGLATFEEVPASNYWTKIIQETDDDESEPLYQVKVDRFQVFFNTDSGFTLEGEPDGFIIETTLVEGLIKQQLNDSNPAAFVQVLALSTKEDNKVIQKVFTDSKGRYQFDKVKPGKVIISPQPSDTESRQIFKPANRTTTVEVGKKTTLQGFQVFGGSISGRVASLRDGPVPYAQIEIDGVNKTKTDREGVFYVNFDTFPAKHTIMVHKDFYIFDPKTFYVTEDMT